MKATRDYQYSDAIALYDRALAINPNDAGAWEAKSRSLADARRISEALSAIDKGIALVPDYPGFKDVKQKIERLRDRQN